MIKLFKCFECPINNVHARLGVAYVLEIVKLVAFKLLALTQNDNWNIR